MTNSVHMDLLAALDLVLLEHAGGGSFKVLEEVPQWWTALYPQGGAGGAVVQPGERFPFLENFQVDAELFWAERRGGRLQSGVWHETNTEGKDCHLEAAALYLDEREFLIIEFMEAAGDERQGLIQKAREHELDRLREQVKRDQEEESLRQVQDLL
jgi:hypothetical protein